MKGPCYSGLGAVPRPLLTQSTAMIAGVNSNVGLHVHCVMRNKTAYSTAIIGGRHDEWKSFSMHSLRGALTLYKSFSP